MLATAISIVAIALSAVTFGVSYRSSQVAERRARMPVLVFVYTPEGWVLRNVGNGPALNIEVAQLIVHSGQWIFPVRVPPIGRGNERLLKWLGHDNVHGFGAVYEDFLGTDENSPAGQAYTVTSRKDRNTIKLGRHLPTWPTDKSVAQWRTE